MRGCLLIHGLTETPACLGPLPERLRAAGFDTFAPALLGHGGTAEDLIRSTWQEWYTSVRQAYAELRKRSDEIFFVGISLGSLLGLKLALDEGAGIRAMALLATPILLRRSARALASLVRRSPLRSVIRKIPKDWSKSSADPEGRRIYRANSLHFIPGASVFQLMDFQEYLAPRLAEITTPVLLIHGAQDRVAPPRNMELLRRSLGSPIVETLLLPKSRHVLTLDYEKDVIAEKTLSFFRRISEA